MFQSLLLNPWDLSAPWILVILLGIGLLITQWRLSRARNRYSRASIRRNAAARRAERAALAVLAKQGYRILKQQAEARWELGIDDETLEVRSRVDLIVEKGDRIFVADVKSGNLVPDPSHPATRRQMLEYLLVFEADGALIVVPEQERIYRMSFESFFD